MQIVWRPGGRITLPSGASAPVLDGCLDGSLNLKKSCILIKVAFSYTIVELKFKNIVKS